jgi:hypothetical protein
MSQDTFPFAPGDEATQFADDTDGERNKKAILVAGGVAALVLGAAAYFFVGGGGEEEDISFTPVKRAPRAAAVAPKAPAVKKVPVAYKEQLGRDPFRALYVVPKEQPAAAAPAPAAAAPVAAAPAAAGAGTTPLAPVAQRYTLKLVSISPPSPEVRFTTWLVDGKKTTVIPAQRFGKYGELVVLAFSKNSKGVVDKAIIQVGDDSPVDIAVGESKSVL